MEEVTMSLEVSGKEILRRTAGRRVANPRSVRDEKVS